MSLDFLVAVPENGILRERPLQLPLETRLSDVLSILVSKFITKSSDTPLKDSNEWALFWPKRSIWLNSSQTLGFYNLSDQARLELKQRCATLRVVLSDSTRKTIKYDRLQPVSALIHAISEKMRLGSFGDTYGLRHGDFIKADGQISRSPPSEWLRSDQPLDEQVGSSEEVYFSKRFFDLSPSETLTNATDEHLSFFEARNQFLGGLFDVVIRKSVAIELSTILLLHRIGCQPKSVSNEIQDNLQAILPPKYLKKPKSSVLSGITSLYESFQSQSWASEPRSVKRRFILTIIRVPTFGSVSFCVDSARCATAEYSNVYLVLSSHFLQLASSRSPRIDKSNEVLYSITMARLTRKSTAKNTVTLTVDASSPQPLSIVLVTEHSHIIDEYISGFLHMRSAFSKEASSTLKTGPSASMSSSIINTSSLDTAVRSALQVLNQIQSDLFHIVMQEESQTEALPEEDSSPQSMTIGQWFSQAATHLASVSRLALNLSKHIRSTNFADKESCQRLVGSLAIFCHTIVSIGRCIVKSTDHRMSSQQTICFITRTLLAMGSRLVMLAAPTEFPEMFSTRTSRMSELSFCELVLPIACGILDVAMRARLCDEASSVCMLVCCRDLRVAASFISNELLNSSASSDAVSEAFSQNVSDANSSFWWHCRLFQMASTVVLHQETELMGSVLLAIGAVSSTASSALSVLMEKTASDTTFGAQTDSSEVISRLKWSWGCLDQSLNCFKFFLSQTETPAGDLDPMLPVVLFELTQAVDAFIHVPSLVDNLSQSTVIKCGQSFVRTLAKQSSFEYSKLAVQVSARLETAIDKFRSIDSSDLSTKSSRRKSSKAPTLSRRAAPTAAVGILDASIAALYELRPVGSHTKLSLRYLLFNSLALRSTLHTAGGLQGILARYVDAICMRNYLEQVDVMIHNLVDSLSAAMADPSAIPIDVFKECKQILSTIFTTEESDPRKLGFFHAVLRAQISRLSADLDSLTASPTALGFATPHPSEISVRRGKRASLLIRPGSKGSLARSGSEAAPSGGYFAVPTAVDDPGALIFKSADGSAESLNEAALLRITSRLITDGDCPELGISFKDALEICSTTFPYWTSAEAFTVTVVSPFISSNPTCDEVTINVGARAAVALSKLLRLHPFVLQDPTSRMAVNTALANLRSMGTKAESSVLAVEDTLRESLEHIARPEKLSAAHRAVFASEKSDATDLLSVDLQSLANQLTLVEQRFMEAVSVPDLMNSTWTKRHTSVSAWVSHSNDISRWLASRILQLPKRKDRAKLISRLIRLAEILRDLNNFSSMLTVFLTLSMECVSRLRKTWDWSNQILHDQFAKLKEDIRPMQNFAGYRELLRKAPAPCIPYLAVLMRDMVMVEEVLSQTSSEGRQTGILYNLSHLQTATRVLHSQFVQFSKARFSFEEDPILYREILNPAAFDLIHEDALMDKAKHLEPEKSRSTKQLTLPRLDASLNRAVSGISPPSEPKMRNSTEYGVRSMVTPRLQPGGDSNLWKRQATLLASACEAAATNLSDLGKIRVAQLALSVSDLFHALLKEGGSAGSARSAGGEEDDVSISSFVKDMTLMLSHLSELRCSWESTRATSTFTTWYVSREHAQLIIAIIMQCIKGVHGMFQTGVTFAARVAAALVETAGGNSDPDQSGLFSLTLQVPSRDFDSSSVESSIMGSLAPSLANAFSNFKGRLTCGVTDMFHSSITVSVISPLKHS
eukprot:TRINITY_DN4979_c0_g1_i1.p1 TRINITY_DN4979_c0_g1~~TRINITY_DN4979_c0_g1_i1.p1  ORF type:complete len:1714 (-),score=161.57 TRINITY_DN4979_c0_g1_i1:184-5325(-)